MLAKVIAHGPDRPTALRRLRAALDDTRVLGMTVNTAFLRRLLADPAVVQGRLDTGLVEARLDALVDTAVPPEVPVAAALSAQRALEPVREPGTWIDPFSVPSGWRIGEPAWTVHRFRVGDGEPVEVRVRRPRHTVDAYDVSYDGGTPSSAALHAEGAEGVMLTWNGITHNFDHAVERTAAGELVHWLARGADTWRLRPFDPVDPSSADAAGAADGALSAPMPGTVTVVKAAVGDQVTAGQTVLVVEAMKMEHALIAPFDGILAEVRVEPGRSVAMDEILAVIAPLDVGAANTQDGAP
jgi:acetyl-CoA/propionyl-CoA carboxylase biotin carboxyl carrier protein